MPGRGPFLFGITLCYDYSGTNFIIFLLLSLLSDVHPACITDQIVHSVKQHCSMLGVKLYWLQPSQQLLIVGLSDDRSRP